LVKVTSWAGVLISVGVKKKSCASFLDIYLFLLSKGDRNGCNDNRGGGEMRLSEHLSN